MSNQRGFTIVELMIATAVFSVVLVIVTSGVIKFTQQYYKGIVTNQTQNVARTAVNEIAQEIQFGSGTPTTIAPSRGISGYCINGKPYYYALGLQLGGSNTDKTADALVATNASCGSSVPAGVDIILNGKADLNSSRELLGKNMRLTAFSVADSGSLITVTMRVAYGDYDVLCVPNLITHGCTPPASPPAASYFTDQTRCALEGEQYCSIVQFSASVAKRLQ